MIKKKYVLLLCEDEFNGENYIDTRRLEIASHDSTFDGQAQNILFYTKIDGTHELTFNLNKYYFDESSGKTVKNILVDKIVNKSKIETIIEQPNGEMKSFFMIVNKREDKKEGKITTYTYSCSDAFIEELAKTGYNLKFYDEIEVQDASMKTIHELAEQIVEGTDWQYVKENTDTLYEYSSDFIYNFEQQRYDEKYIPIPRHATQYVSEIKGFAYKTPLYSKQKSTSSQGQNQYHPIYCYENIDTITSNMVKNILSNSSDFVSIVGWDIYSRANSKYVLDSNGYISHDKREVTPEDTKYNLLAWTNSSEDLILTNTTATSTNITLEAQQFYAFRYKKINNNTGEEATAATLKEILISNSALSRSSASLISIKGPDTDAAGRRGFLPNTYYIIKIDQKIRNPFLSFNFGANNYHERNKLELENIEFFRLQGKTEKDNLYFVQNYEGIRKLTDFELNLMIFPSQAPTSYSYSTSKYFYRKKEYYTSDNEHINTVSSEDNEDQLVYLNFQNDVNTFKNYIKDNNSWVPFSPLSIDKNTFKDIQIKKDADRRGADVNTIYFCGKDQKYYQYYYLDSVKVNGQISSGGKWNLALLVNSEKIKALKAEKSNRFNLIQELSELFKVWPVFNIYRDPVSKKIIKQFWFKETCLRETFAGFHAGVNVRAISRVVDSNEIVTKLYVEDVENDNAKNGYVSISEATDNPWKENYYYNFRYYVEQQFLNQTIEEQQSKKLVVEKDLEELYSSVNELNEIIYNLNMKNSDIYYDLNEIKNTRQGMSYAISAKKQYIREQNELKNKKVKTQKGEEISQSEETKKKIEDNIATAEALINQWEKEDTENLEKQEQLQSEYDNNILTSKEKEERKKELINSFENRYSQYIKEGTWTDSSYLDPNNYYYDSLKVSNTSAEPNISWTINIIDGSCFQNFKEFNVQVGDQTFLVDPEFFDDKSVTHKFQILISGYKDYLDNPIKNEIEVRNYLTSFEDLFQRIAAATQTIQLKEQVYDRAALLAPTGIDSTLLQKTLDNNALTLINSSRSSFVLNENGLSLASLTNPAKQLKIVGEGIFLTDSYDESGDPAWKAGITVDGISADIITSGALNTSNVNIITEGQLGFKWDALGITAKQPYNDQYNDNCFIRLDGFGLYFVNNKTELGYNEDGIPWYLNKKYADSVSLIQEKAEVSITKNGFRLDSEETDSANYYRCFFSSNPRSNEAVLSYESSYGGVTLTRNGSLLGTNYLCIGNADLAPALISGDGFFSNNIYLAGDLYIPDGQGGWGPVDLSSGGSGDFIIPVHPNGENDPVMASAWWESYSGHKGLDLVLKNGDQRGKPVYASRAGTVDDAYSSWDPSQGKEGMKSYGNYIRINHGDYQGSNYKTRYAHLLSLVVKIGDHVAQGQLIGYIDSTGNVTGPHLHFEIIENNVRVNPELYLPPVPHQ